MLKKRKRSTTMAAKHTTGPKTQPGFASTGAKVILYAPNLIPVISSLYRTLMAALMETVKNAVDAGSKRVEITIDLHAKGRKEDRRIVVCDNGSGMSLEEFDHVMANVCKSGKVGNEDASGEHGLGLMAFVGKAHHYVLTSGTKRDKGTAAWEGYHSHCLSDMKIEGNELYVPRRVEKDLSRSPEWWQTRVEVRGFVGGNRLMIMLDTLEQDIRSDLNALLLKHGTEVTINHIDARGRLTVRKIGGRHYQGERFKQFTTTGEHCGRVTLEMYRPTTPVGDVVMRTQKSGATKSWRKLKASALELGMNRDLADALASGYFDGVITVQNIEWDYNRQGFLPTNEAAWMEVILALEEFLKTEDAQRHMKNVQGQKEEEREFEFLQRLATYFSDLNLLNPDLLFDPLSMLSGAVSEGHTKLPTKTPSYNGRTRLPSGRITRVEKDPQPPRASGQIKPPRSGRLPTLGSRTKRTATLGSSTSPSLGSRFHSRPCLVVRPPMSGI